MRGDEWMIETLREDELLATLPTRHPPATSPTIKMEQLVAEPLVLMKEAHCLRGQTLQLCRDAYLATNISIKSSQLETVLALVEAGLGLSLIPRLAVAQSSGRQVVFRSLAPQPVYRSIALVWPRQATRTHAFEVFVQLVRKTLAP